MPFGCRRDSLANERFQWDTSDKDSFNVHDPLGLIAMPMAPMTAGLENSIADYPKLITDSGQSTGVPTAVGSRNWMLLLCRPLINMMEASEHGYCGDISSLSAPMRRICPQCAGRTLSNRAMRANG